MSISVNESLAEFNPERSHSLSVGHIPHLEDDALFDEGLLLLLKNKKIVRRAGFASRVATLETYTCSSLPSPPGVIY